MLSAKQGNHCNDFFKRPWYDAVLYRGLNPGPPALEAITLPQFELKDTIIVIIIVVVSIVIISIIVPIVVHYHYQSQSGSKLLFKIKYKIRGKHNIQMKL